MRPAGALDRRSVGIGLRAPHYGALVEQQPKLGFLEAHSENFFGAGGPALAWLERFRADYALSLHGVGLSLGSADPLDERHLGKLDALVKRIEPALVSEHLCWSSIAERHANDLLPLPFTREALETAIVRRACERFDPMTRSSIGPMITAQRRAARDNDHATFQEHDERFHAALAAGADAELAWQTVVNIKCHMDRVCHLTLLDRTSMLRIITQHEAIMAAIDAQDAEAADKAMRHHLTEILRALPQVLTDRADLFE